MSLPRYYECPSCSCYHIVGYNGSCDDADSAFLDDELNEKHGVDGWEEIEVAAHRDPEPRAAPVRRKNYNRILAITEDTDINGAKLEPGCRVRCFCARYDAERDWILGIDTTDTHYEGELLEIVDYQDSWSNQFRAYKIAITRCISHVVVRTRNDFEIIDALETTYYRDGRRFPDHFTANGHQYEDGTRTFGIVRITS